MAPAERRALLVDAAVRVIERGGLSAATTRAIVAEAGMSLASFHYVFASRDELMREVLEHVLAKESAAALTVMIEGHDIRSILRAGLESYLTDLAAEPRWELALLELLQYSLRTPGLEHLARDQWASYRATIARVLEVGADRAGVRWILPVEEMARLVLTITDGVTLAWLADRNTAAARTTLLTAADALAAFAQSLDEEPSR